MGTWGKEQSVCATCRYWSGQRKVDFTASFFETKSNAEGYCNGPIQGSFQGLVMHEGSSCMRWEKYR